MSDDDKTIEASKPRDLTETEVELASQILREIDDGTRTYPDWYYEQYQEDDFGDDDEDDDPDANQLDPAFEHLTQVELDDEGIEVGFDPIYGPSNPIDQRTIINPQDSYIIDDQTRDDAMVTPTFKEGDLEIPANAEITQFRKSLKIVQTYTDPFLDMEVPRYQARWYGYPEQQRYPDKDVMENRFTDPKDATNFDEMTPYRARKTAVEMARAKNNEWLPKGKSAAFHNAKTDIYGKLGLKVGSLEKGEIDEKA